MRQNKIVDKAEFLLLWMSMEREVTNAEAAAALNMRPGTSSWKRVVRRAAVLADERGMCLRPAVEGNRTLCLTVDDEKVIGAVVYLDKEEHGVATRKMQGVRQILRTAQPGSPNHIAASLLQIKYEGMATFDKMIDDAIAVIETHHAAAS